jgi:hypothetical protein
MLFRTLRNLDNRHGLLDQLARDRLAAVAGELRAESQAVDLGEVLADQLGSYPSAYPAFVSLVLCPK